MMGWDGGWGVGGWLGMSLMMLVVWGVPIALVVWLIARHYEREVLPLRQIISDETMLNYNAMIRDLFSLLAEARARITANIQALDARRGFWLASVDLQAAIIGGRGGGEVAEMPSTTAAGGGGEPGGH